MLFYNNDFYKLQTFVMKKLFLFLLFFAIDIYPQWTFDAVIPYDSIHAPVIRDICVIDTNTSWVLGNININFNYESPFFAKKNYEGWKYLSTDLNPEIKIFSFTATDSLNVWLGTNHPSNIYHSSNGGINWVLQYHVDDTGHVVGINFCKQNKQIGYAFCHLAFNTFWNGVGILKTTNGGLNWTRWNFEYYGYSAADNSMCIVDSNYAWFGADDVLSNTSKIISTTNGGLNWAVTDINVGNDAPFTIQFSEDKKTGLFASQTNPYAWFYRTTNAGINWNIVYSTSYYYSKTMIWVPGTANIYGNSTFNLVRSINNGITWNSMSGGPGTDLQSLDAVKVNNSTIYALAVTYGRGVYKLLDSVSVIGIENTGTTIPKEYKLYQNYPNPFNPVTSIKYTIPNDDFVSLKIYDLKGELVTTLINENQIKGEYDVSFNGESYSSGVYFYVLEAGKLISSKKMVLVK